MGMKFTNLYIGFLTDKGEFLDWGMELEDELGTELVKNEDLFLKPKSAKTFANTLGYCFSCKELMDWYDEDEYDNDGENKMNFFEEYFDGCGNGEYDELKKLLNDGNRKVRNCKRILLLIDRETYEEGGHAFTWNLYDIQSKNIIRGYRDGAYPGDKRQSIREFMEDMITK